MPPPVVAAAIVGATLAVEVLRWSRQRSTTNCYTLLLLRQEPLAQATSMTNTSDLTAIIGHHGWFSKLVLATSHPLIENDMLVDLKLKPVFLKPITYFTGTANWQKLKTKKMTPIQPKRQYYQNEVFIYQNRNNIMSIKAALSKGRDCFNLFAFSASKT